MDTEKNTLTNESERKELDEGRVRESCSKDTKIINTRSIRIYEIERRESNSVHLGFASGLIRQACGDGKKNFLL